MNGFRIFSKDFMICDVIDSGLYEAGSDLLDPGFRPGTTRDRFWNLGTVPMSSDFLHKSVRGLDRELAHLLKSTPGKLSGPQDRSGSVLFSTFSTFSSLKNMSLREKLKLFISKYSIYSPQMCTRSHRQSSQSSESEKNLL